MCVRKKPKYLTLESNGWGWEEGKGRGGGGGLEVERPEMERETKEQWETDLLQDSCSLSGACSQHICSPPAFFFFFFFALVIIWSHRISSRLGGVYVTGSKATLLQKHVMRSGTHTNSQQCTSNNCAAIFSLHID